MAFQVLMYAIIAIHFLAIGYLVVGGFLATGAFYAAYAHQKSDVARYAAAVDEAFAVIAKAHEKNEVERLLKGPVAHAGFYRLS